MFKEIIEDELGIVNLDTYKEYKIKKCDEGITEEEIQRLSPDTIKSDKFWEWIDQSEFAKDGVSFGATKDTSNDYCNFMGELIGLESGCLNYFNRLTYTMAPTSTPAKILEIGPGFGSFKHRVEVYPFFKYYGVDVYPKIEGVLPTKDGDTLLPDEVTAEKFTLVYSSNVFQHLSARQQASYFSQVSNLLAPGGVFSFNTLTRREGNKTGFVKDDRSYLCHYGQYIIIPTPDEVYDAIQQYFDILSYSVGPGPDLRSYHCIPKNR